MRLVDSRAYTLRGDFNDPVQIWHAFVTIINGLPGITVINSITHLFPGGGFTGLILLGESHAAIHTWPEYNLAWVELVTCGDPSALALFESRLTDMGLDPTRDGQTE
jgi:S-adenosylmethionine/arginine decarboxylase-like enzyme